MSTNRPDRSSASSSSSNGSAYQLILDHILTYPGSYEIPLRAMYTLNSQPRRPSGSGTPSSSNESSPVVPQDAFSGSQTTESFTRNLMTQLSNLPNQASTLPPSFVTSFILRCFPLELTHVDFPQALTGLDYLKDLESRRRREVAAALDRLDIDRDTLSNNAAEIPEHILPWVNKIRVSEHKIDNLYTSVWIGLRRWILINEMSLRPFNKHNCIAMLNTLYPPMGLATKPTSKLDQETLMKQRAGYFKYIQAVEQSGPSILGNLIKQGAAPTEANGWAGVNRSLGLYLQLANSVITESMAIGIPASPHKVDTAQSRHTRKADSGISFTHSERRPSTRGSNGEPPSPIDTSRPKTPSAVRSGTALEKLARGLKGIGRGRTDATEMISDEVTSSFPPTEKPTMLRKMRSFGSLTERRPSVSSLALRPEPQTPTFNVDEMRRQRARYEASVGVSRDDRPGKRASN